MKLTTKCFFFLFFFFYRIPISKDNSPHCMSTFFFQIKRFLGLYTRWHEQGQLPKAYLVSDGISICSEEGPVWSMPCWRADALASDLLQVNSHVIYGYGCNQRSVCRHAASSRLTSPHKHHNVLNYHKMTHCAVHNILYLPACLSHITADCYKNISPLNIEKFVNTDNLKCTNAWD